MNPTRIRQLILGSSLIVALFFAVVDCAKKEMLPTPILLDIRVSNYNINDMQKNIPRELFVRLTKNPEADQAADPWSDLTIEPTLQAVLEEDGKERKLVIVASSAGAYQVKLGSKTNPKLERTIQITVR